MPRKVKRKKAPKLRLEWVEAGSLTTNPHNWRRHPEGQKSALKALLDDKEVGWAGALLYNERTKHLIDGHLRRDSVSADTIVPVLIGSWSQEAEEKILLTLDPLAAMAEGNVRELKSLLERVDLSEPGFDQLQGYLSEQLNDMERTRERDMEDLVPLEKVKVRKPPGRTWILIGIETVRFGEISETIRRIAKKPGIFCEVTANDEKLPGD